MAETYAQKNMGYFGIVKQTAINTGVASTHFISVSEATLKPSLNREVLRAEVRNGLAPCASTNGRVEIAGTLSGNLHPDEFAIMYAWLLGNNNAVAGSAAIGYTHTFNLADSTNLYSQFGATIEVFLGGGGGATNNTLIDYLSCFIKKATFTIPQSGAITYSLDVIALKYETVGTLSTPTYTCLPVFEGWMGKVKVGSAIGSVADVEVNGDISVTIDMMIDVVPSINGSQFNAGRTVGMPEVNVSFSAFLKDTLADWANLYLNDTIKALEVNIAHTLLAGSSSGVYSTRFLLPKVIFTEGVPTLSGDKNIEQPIAVTAVKDATAGYMLRIIDVNSQSGVYAV